MPASAHGRLARQEQVPIAVVGPTATGKSELALRLAERLGGEIVNADAMQLYRGMDIGTAKLTVAERRGITHHQLDVLDVTEPASVAAYQRHATSDLHRVRAAGGVPVIVGGSGLYLRSLLDELTFPGTDAELRAGLERELADLGAAALHERLRTVDPVAAESILPSNGRRVVRALEVTELTGRPFSATMPRPGPTKHGTVLIGLDTDPGVLDERVSARTAAMFAAGLVEEARVLLTRGLRDGRTARGALGYRQAIDVLDGVCSIADAQERTAQATRRFVRRQRSWFRRDDRITWLDAQDDDLVGKALAVYPGLSW